MSRSVVPGACSVGAAQADKSPVAGSVAGWRTVLGVFKLRIGVLIMITALGGLAIVPEGQAGALQVLVLALSVLGASASAGAFNQFVEAESDRLMPRTARRAFASGALPRSAGWMCAIGLLLVVSVGAAAWFINLVSAAYVLLGALTYALLYTLGLKRRTPWNIVIGGLSGSFAVLAGAAAVNPEIGVLAWLLALVLFLWTPPHFWSLAIANEREYAAAKVPMLPVVVGIERAGRIVHANTIGLVAVSLIPMFFGAGWIYLVGASVGGLHFLRKTRALSRDPSRGNAMAAFFASMVQLSMLLAAVAIEWAVR